MMRDVQTNAQYRVANGGTLGRMRVDSDSSARRAVLDR